MAFELFNWKLYCLFYFLRADHSKRDSRFWPKELISIDEAAEFFDDGMGCPEAGEGAVGG